MHEDTRAAPTLTQRATLWIIEGALLGAFMFAVAIFAPPIFLPNSPLQGLLTSDLARSAAMGIVMGLTAIALIYSPLGGRSGAQMNPAVTLAFLSLGKIRPFDAAGYIAGQFAGGLTGVLLGSLVIGTAFSEPPVHYGVTTPGSEGVVIALLVEIAMSFLIMILVLWCSSVQRTARFTGLLAGMLVALYITFLGRFSGMSINPARSLASALPAHEYQHLWIYFAGPISGTLLAARAFSALKGFFPECHCCKINHRSRVRCVHCGCEGEPAPVSG